MNNIIHTIRHTARAATMLLLALLTAQTAWAQTPSGNWADEGNRATTVPQSEDGSTLYISTAEQLACYAYGVNNDWETTGSASGYYCGRTVELQADIDLSAHYWTPIGKNTSFYFNGFFHGNGHVISGLYILESSNNYGSDQFAGLFGVLRGRKAGTGDPCITNIVLDGCDIRTRKGNTNCGVGGLVGRAEAGIISDCIVLNSHVENSMYAYIGALVGRYANEITTTDNYCYNVTVSIGTGATADLNTTGYSPAYKVTLNNGVTTSTAAKFSYGGNSYYAGTITLGGGTAPLGYAFSGYTVNGSAISGNTFNISSDATVAAIYTDMFGMADGADGSAEHPYVISNEDGWNFFCDCLQDNDTYNRFSGKTVRLDANIGTAESPVTRMAGGSGHEFTGTFDGGGHTLTVNYANTDNNTMTAPFSYVDGATIQNLIVGGTISGTAYRAAGIVGETPGQTTITNCVSSVDISSGRYTGGISIGGLVTITGCVFNGKIVGTTWSGGFVGYSNTATAISNSLFAPQDGSSISGGTFYYNGGGDITPTNSYYTAALGTAQGKATRTVAAAADVTIEAIALTGTATQYTVSGITAYSGGGLQRGETLYYGSGDQLSLTLSNSATGAPQGYQYGYTASAGTLSGTTLTMPDQDVTISVTIRSTGEPVTVAYINDEGTTDEASAIALDGTETSLGTYGQEKWYFVGIDFSHTGEITCYGDVHIILCDGKTMTVNGNGSYALWSPFGNFYFYGQNGQTGTLNATGCIDAADNNAGTLTINGGIINATGDYGISAYGLIINRGTVNATGNDGDGIWSGGNITLGWSKPTDRISITASSYRGTVAVASGKKLHNGSDFLSGTLGDPATALNGKTLRPAATATYTTADGTTATADAILLDASDNSLPAGNYLATGTLNYTHGITLTGNVTLILADNCHMNVGTSGEGRINGKGIAHSGFPTLTITSEANGSGNGNGALNIYTTGSHNHGIITGAITINGGNVTADTDGSNAFALYPADTDLTINGGTVTATTTGTVAQAIRAYRNFNYNGGNVTATAAKDYAIMTYGNYTFSWRTPADRITIGATGLYAPDDDKTATFARLFTDAADPAAAPADNYYGGTYTGDALNALAGKTLSGTDTLPLADDADNTPRLAAANGMTALNVALSGRTLYKDGSWNTLCLPFAVSSEQLNVSSNPLNGATIKALDEDNSNLSSDGTLTLTFAEATSIEAGKPYIVKWTTTGENISNPVFEGVTITATAPVAVVFANNATAGPCQFVGQFSPFTIVESGATGDNEGNKNEIILMGAGSKLGYAASAPRTLRSFRAHFMVPADGTTGAPVNGFMLDFGDGDNATGIISVSKDSGIDGVADGWYSLDGRKLDGQPARKGVYIHGGRKVVVSR